MNATVTVNLDEDVLQLAEQEARARQTTVPEVLALQVRVMAQNWLASRAGRTPLTDALRGSVKLPADFDERAALLIFAAFLGRAFARLGYRNAALCSDGPYRFRKSAAIHLHDEFENVAALTTAEAVIELLHGMDGKRRRFFLMEGAEAAEILAGFFQAHVFANDADNVRLLFDALRK